MILQVFRYFAVVGSAGLLAGLSVLVSPLIWPADPDSSLVIRNGRLVGEVVGYVWRSDPSTATIHVSASLVGLRAFPVRINAETRITDGDKEGAIGDLTQHRRVRLVYEALPHGRLASSVELLRQGPPATPAGTTDAAAGMLPTPAPGYWVEVGVFADVEADAAGALATRLLEHNLTVAIESLTVRDSPHRVMRVQVGPFPDESAALAAQQNLRAFGHQARALW